MAQLVCDTDFLLKVTTEPVPSLRAFCEKFDFSFATIPEVVNELNGLTLSDRPATTRKAKSALRLVGSRVKVIDTRILKNNKIDADVALFDYAKRKNEDSLVATLDGNLLSQLEKNQLPYFTLRHNKPFAKSLGRATYLSTKK